MIFFLAARALGADPSPLLERPEYRFCNEAGVDAPQALAWCDSLADLPPEVCPGLRATCAGALGPESGCGGGGGTTGRAGGAPQAPRRPPELPEWPDLGCPDIETGFFEAAVKWGMAAAVALAIAILLRLLVRWMGRDRPAVATAEAEASPTAAPDPDEVPDLPSADLLAAAREALAADAVVLARGAALRRLAERGRITLHRSRTDREHVRSMRDEPEVFDDLREVARSAETVRWGGLGIDLAVARRVLEAAARLVVAATAALALLGEARAADRYGPRGDAGLGALLERAGHPVTWRTEPLEALDASTELLVLDLGWVAPTVEDERALRAWVEAGGVLLVAGDASGVFPELGEFDVGPAAPPLGSWLADTGLAPPWWPGPVAVWTVGEPIVGTPGAAALAEIPVGAGVVVGLADGRLLENGALIRPENRVFLGEIFQLGQALGGWPVDAPIPVELATRAYAIAGGDSAGCQPAEGLAHGRLIALILQVLLLWGVVAAMRATSLTVPRDPPAEDRLLFSDHAEALARRAWRSGDRAWADAAVARLWLHRLGPAGLESAAQRAGQSPAEAKQTAERVERLARGGTSDPELVEALWRMTR